MNDRPHPVRWRAVGRFAAALGALVVTVALLGQFLPAGATASVVSLSASTSTVAPGSTVDLTAGMPVVGAGSVSQEIVQQIDPAKVKLTSASDITYPTGWTLSYCSGASTDCTVNANFTATAPTTTAGWAAVKAVKATGALVTEGADGGRQIAQTSASGGAVAQTPLTLPSSGLGLDGYKVFFDPGRTRVFNIYHHSSGGVLDCYVVLTGSRCAGFPFDYGGQSQEAALGVIVGTTAWIQGIAGLHCVDLAAVIANTSNAVGVGSPTKCFGATSLVTLKAATRFTWFTGGTPLGQSSETQLYALDSSSTSAMVYCVDTATRAPCATATRNPQLPGAGNQAVDPSNIFKWGDRLYVSVSNANVDPVTEKVSCVSISTGSLCPGWSSSPRVSLSTSSATRSDGKFFPVPDASGALRAVCYMRGLATSHTCWEADGTQTLSATYNLPNFDTRYSGGTYAYGTPTQIGTRVYYGNSFWGDPTPVFTKAEALCYDALAASGAGGRCNDAATNLRSSTTQNYVNYSVTPDPVIPNCLWVTQHFNPVFKTVNILTGELGCSAIAPQRAVFPAATAVPRMGCSSSTAIYSWRSFTLDTPAAGFTSAKLTVQTAAGADIVGWKDISLTPGVAVDLSALSVATSGQQPKFVVDVLGATAAVTASARISAVGDSPQLCLRVTAVVNCPTSVGPIAPSSLVGGSTTPSASGSSTDGSNTTTMTPASTTLTISAPTGSQCGGSLSGRAGTLTLGTTGDPLVGLTVSLLDSAGAVVRDGGGSPVTATTDSSGNYSFGYLVPANYKVQFAGTGTTSVPASAVISSVTVASGGSGTVSASAGSTAPVTSNAATVPLGGAAVVNGLYIANPVANPNTSTGASGAVQTITVLANDTPSTGATYSGGSTALKLCGTGQTSPNCTATSVVISGQGSYAVSGTNITFTPCTGANTPVMTPACTAAFTGTATAATYQSTDSLGRVGSSTVTPTVVPLPTATADAQTAAWDTNQTYSPTANDSAGPGSTLVAIPTGICLSSVTVASSCTAAGNSITVSGQGTYTLDPVSGVVTFDPLPTFIGTATPIKYAVADSLGQKSLATITPTVLAPPAPVGTPDTSTGALGVAQTVSPLANDTTAAAGITFSASSVRLCSTGQSAPNCTATSLVVSGQGAYSVNSGTGAITFTPCTGLNTPAMTPACTAAFSGIATPVGYQVSTNTSQTASSTYTPTVVSLPTATADAQTAAWDTNQTYTPTANDSAGTGSTLVAVPTGICLNSVTVASSCTTVGNSITISGQGTYTLNSVTGVVTFDPLPSFWGTATPIKYAVADSLGQKSLATITPTVQTPPAPTANPDSSTGAVGATQSVSPLANDSSVSGITFTASSVKLCSTGQSAPNCTATTLVVSGQGSYSVNAVTGAITFTPCAGVGTPSMSPACTAVFTGTATPATYQVSTNLNQTSSSTYTPLVVPLPTANPDALSDAWDTNQTYSPAANDTAGSGTTLVAVPSGICLNSVTVASSCTTVGNSITVSGQGTYTLNTVTGVVTFDPLPSFHGQATPIKYAVADSLGQKSLSTITPTVAYPPAPTATAQSRTVIPGGTATFTTLTGTGGLASTGGPSFDTTATCLVDASVTPNTCGTSLTVSGEGTYTVDRATGVVTFVADVGITPGTKTPVTYRVFDATGQSATSTLTPIVPPPPTLNPDHTIDEQNVTQTISVLSNDTADVSTAIDPTSVKLCPVSAVAPFSPSNCTLTTLTVDDVGRYSVNPDGTVSFEPCTAAAGMTCAGNYFGSTVFSGVAPAVNYVVSDLIGQFGSSTITVEVLPPPVVQPQNDAQSGPFGAAIVFDPLANDSGGSTNNLTAYTTVGTTAIDPTTIALCGPSETAPHCTSTSLTTPQGIYVLDPVTHSITFTPATNFVGTPPASPLYVVCNQLGGTWAPNTPPVTCKTASVTPTIAPPAAPTATDDTLRGPYNTALTFPVLTNDTKDSNLSIAPTSVKLCAAGQTPPNCTATTLSSSGQGTYTVDPSTGQVTFTPLPSFQGTPTLTPTYQFTDSYGQNASAVITPTIDPPPAPAATPQSKLVLPGNSVSFTNTIGASALASGTGLRTGPSGGPCLIDPSDSICKTSFTIAGEGDWAIDQTTGIATFTADASTGSGAKTAVTYQVTDAVGQVATSTLTPSVPPVPALASDVGTDSLDRNQTFTVLANDTAGTGTTLVANTLHLCATDQTPPNCDATTVTIDGEGTYTLDPVTGVVTFDPTPTFFGTATPVTYQVTDSMGRVASATVNPTVTAVAPAATPDTSSGPYNTAQTKNLLTNDTTDPGASLDIATLRLCDPTTLPPQTPNNCTIGAGTTITVDHVGTYVLDAQGVITFTPDASFTGSAPPLTYQVQDSLGQHTHSTYTPTVTPPTAPSANPDTSIGAQGATQTRDVAANDTPAISGQTIDVTTVRLCGTGETAPNCTATTLTTPDEGTYTLDITTGIITFTPCSAAGVPVGASCTAPFVGVATPIAYQVSTNTAQTVSSTYTPTVVPPPTASPDGSQGVKGAPQTITLLSNDAPGRTNAPLDPSTIRLCAANETAPNCTRTTLNVRGEGTYSVNGTGTVTFTPDPNFVGPATPQRYVIADVLGQTTNSTIQPKVVPPPAPIAIDDVRTGPADTPMVIDPLANDRPGDIPAGETGTVALVRSSLRLCAPTELAPNCTATTLTTADGTYTVDTTTGFVTFMPRPGFSGQVTQPVTYQIANDWTGPSGIGITTATITPIIDPAAPPVVPPTIPTPPGSTDTNTDPATPNASQLPNTGSDTCALVLWGALLLGSGAALVALRRRAITTR